MAVGTADVRAAHLVDSTADGKAESWAAWTAVEMVDWLGGPTVALMAGP